jgi:hypothetical protein
LQIALGKQFSGVFLFFNRSVKKISGTSGSMCMKPPAAMIDGISSVIF